VRKGRSGALFFLNLSSAAYHSLLGNEESPAIQGRPRGACRGRGRNGDLADEEDLPRMLCPVRAVAPRRRAAAASARPSTSGRSAAAARCSIGAQRQPGSGFAGPCSPATAPASAAAATTTSPCTWTRASAAATTSARSRHAPRYAAPAMGPSTRPARTVPGPCERPGGTKSSGSVLAGDAT